MKTFFITGANRGIGLGLVDQVLQQGDRVIAACRNPDGARELWELESTYGERLTVIPLDVSDEKDVKALPSRLPGNGAIDVLINCAGVLLNPNLPLKSVPIEDFHKTFTVNCLGPIMVTKAILPYLEQASNPMIVNMSSRMGSIADNGSGLAYSYRMSKTALNMFTKSLAIEYPKIVAVAMHPGWVKTAMGGTGAPTEVAESTRGLMRVINELSPKATGGFIDFRGQHIPW